MFVEAPGVPSLRIAAKSIGGGEVEIAFHQMTEILPVPGVTVVAKAELTPWGAAEYGDTQDDNTTGNQQKKSPRLALIGLRRFFLQNETFLIFHNRDNFANFVHFGKLTQGVRRLGSAALDLCYVAAGRFDGFWEISLKPWDVAAGGLICREAEATITNVKGEADFISPPQSVVASAPGIHARDVRDGIVIVTQRHVYVAGADVDVPQLRVELGAIGRAQAPHLKLLDRHQLPVGIGRHV